MPQVTVTINDRKYRMACEDGQEQQLLALCDDLNRRIAELVGKFGEIGDARLILMAALSIADELTDTKDRIRDVVRTPRCLRAAAADADHPDPIAEAAMHQPDLKTLSRDWGYSQRHLRRRVLAATGHSPRTLASQAVIADALAAAAERIERLTRELNQSLGDGNGVAIG